MPWIYDVLLFITPFALYGLYVLLARRAAAAQGTPHRVPWIALFIVGLVLALGGVVYFGSHDPQAKASGAYHPHWELPRRPAPPVEDF